MRRVPAKAVSKDRNIIPCHLNSEFKHLFGSSAHTELAVELQLQIPGIVKNFSGFSLNDQAHPQARVHTFFLLWRFFPL